VDFAIVKVSKRSAREKSIRHGRPSRLHLWWARRSLAACRAMLMVLLLPEPCDEHCPGPFIDEAHSTVLSYHGWPVKREKPVADNKVSYCLKHFEAWNHDKCHIHYRV
jgi:adenine-specific DNA methylase